MDKKGQYSKTYNYSKSKHYYEKDKWLTISLKDQVLNKFMKKLILGKYNHTSFCEDQRSLFKKITGKNYLPLPKYFQQF